MANTMWQCNVCGEIFNEREYAIQCEKAHPTKIEELGEGMTVRYDSLSNKGMELHTHRHIWKLNAEQAKKLKAFLDKEINDA